ncbi:hypothetical protein EJF36_06760 [Bacillus sp. HMF5848]|uniref:lipocalin family protein n=1 Tax=Bacillus sp. HMF5848 TaxID=2495421 RepID=UPI000F78193D|nr:lipocalin family protein [Bacillus sp. HMF5848]RSK26582.1 hypothetical protein EJF36_06760 [Bacillus sp. HMF5848]
MAKKLTNKISLPGDAGPHSNSNIEWWYYFSYLNGDKGGKYAAMASFFRVGEAECYKGHYLIFTIIDLNRKTKKSYSLFDCRLKKNMLTTYLPFYLLLHPTDVRIWKLYKSLLIGKSPFPHSQTKNGKIKEYPTELIYGKNYLGFMGEKEDSFKVQLCEKDMELALHFTPTKPMSLIGGDGRPDDLYYYSFTRNNVHGQIDTDKGVEIVKGEGWFDHQWGRDYGLIKGVGWNWFGIQLDDGRELLLNEMHSFKETFSPMANLIEDDGSLRFTRNISFQEIHHWKSLKTNARYPIEWKITIPQFSIEILVKAVLPNQEMAIMGPLQAIWEGACSVSGHETLPDGSRKLIMGKGFMELVGYAN